MSFPAVRITDEHVCPMLTVLVPHVGGTLLQPAEPTVLIGGLPGVGVGGMGEDVSPAPPSVVKPDPTVMYGSTPAVSLTATTDHGGTVVGPGEPTVLVGGG